MRKLSTLLVATIFYGVATAGGIVTNTNQSAMFTRLQVRDATLGIDATYFNPAGLTLLPNDGFFISLNNQTLGQTRNITSDYQYLNDGKYVGDISAPFFPGVYAAWKKGNLAISAGFNPIGGGGGGTYESGLPSFEYSPSDLVPALQASGQNAQAYSLDAYFEGTSIMFGYQANVSYKINDFISVALGGRYVTAKDTYKGHLQNIQIDLGGTWMPAATYFNNVAGQAGAAALGMAGLSSAGYGSLTLEQLIAGSTDPAEQALLQGLADGLTQMGQDPSVLTVDQGQEVYAQAATKASDTGYLLSDQEVDAEKTASGFTPIISINISPSEKWNIALKYEHNTKLEFTNKTTSDVTTEIDLETRDTITMFPDGAKSQLDIPSQIVAGLTYRPIDPLLISTGFHYYLDKNADWDGKEEDLDHNSWEFGLGLEYGFTEKLKASAGYLRTQSGATQAYQTDLSFSLPSNSVGGGLAYQILPILELNLGGSYTVYQKGEKNFDYETAYGSTETIQETYEKPIWIVAIGLNFNFGATK